jgi:sugar phosphate isomerase/epimerase
MPDQSAEATLRYVLDSGINAIELMDGPAEMFAGRPSAGRGGARGGGRAGAAAAPAQGPAAPAVPAPAVAQSLADVQAGIPCAPARGGGAGAGGGGRGGGGGRAQATPEQLAAAEELRAWRTSVSMDTFRELRRMYNDAGVTIYAYKPDGLQKNMQTSDAEFDYVFGAASALGASHLTMELPGGPDAEAMLTRMAQFGEKHEVYVGYHTHGQGSMTAFDQALTLSRWNMSNVDLGHYVAAGNVGGTPVQFLERFHDRISSFHLKDRTLPSHCALTVPFGTGDGQLREILLTMKRNQWTFPASVELEYRVPADSDAVKEVRKCVEFCRSVLA